MQKDQAVAMIEAGVYEGIIRRLHEENGRMKARCAAYRRQADNAMAARREYERAKRTRERLLWAVGMLSGGAVGALAICKVIDWVRYFAAR